MNVVGTPIKTTVAMPSQITAQLSSRPKTEEELWEEREQRLNHLLKKEGGPNPGAKEDFDRLLGGMARSSE